MRTQKRLLHINFSGRVMKDMIQRGFVLCSLIIFFSSSLYSQSMNMRFNTYVYSWERQDSFTLDGSSPKTFHMRSYQNLLFDFSKDKFSFNFNFQSDGDIVNRIGKGFNYRFYNIYAKYSNLFDAVDLKLGRQNIFAGVGKGAIDGIYLKIKAGEFKEYQLSGFGGYLTPRTYEFTKHPALKENYMVGGQLSYYGIKDLFIGLSYMNKHQKPESYLADRLDSALTTNEVLIDIDSPADQLAGIDLNYSVQSKQNYFAKIYYDINLKKLYRAEFNARYSFDNNLTLFAGFFYRQPQIAYNRIFWVFQHKENQEFEAGADYVLPSGINIFARAANVFYSDENSLRLQAGFNSESYGFSYIKFFGYAGNSDAVTGYYYRQVIPDILSATVSADYSNYRLGDFGDEKTDAFSGMIGLVYRPVPQFSIDAQGQFITNRIYKFDTRFLFGISYWMFNKF